MSHYASSILRTQNPEVTCDSVTWYILFGAHQLILIVVHNAKTPNVILKMLHATNEISHLDEQAPKPCTSLLLKYNILGSTINLPTAKTFNAFTEPPHAPDNVTSARMCWSFQLCDWLCKKCKLIGPPILCANITTGWLPFILYVSSTSTFNLTKYSPFSSNKTEQNILDTYHKV